MPDSNNRSASGTEIQVVAPFGGDMQVVPAQIEPGGTNALVVGENDDNTLEVTVQGGATGWLDFDGRGGRDALKICASEISKVVMAGTGIAINGLDVNTIDVESIEVTNGCPGVYRPSLAPIEIRVDGEILENRATLFQHTSEINGNGADVQICISEAHDYTANRNPLGNTTDIRINNLGMQITNASSIEIGQCEDDGEEIGNLSPKPTEGYAVPRPKPDIPPR